MAGLHAYHPLPVPPDATTLTLDPEESSHLVRSLRARAGEPIVAFNGTGTAWIGVVAEPDPRGLVMRVDTAQTTPPAAPALVLAQSLPKGGLFDDIIRAAVELGAAAIYPLVSERCEVRLDAARAAAKLARWKTIAVEACKQSGNLFLPHITPPVPLREWLAANRAKTLGLVGSLESGAAPLARLVLPEPAPENLLILIGPEGDFSPAEYAAIREHGFQGVRFGATVLRVPTAAHYALVALDQLRQRHR